LEHALRKSYLLHILDFCLFFDYLVDIKMDVRDMKGFESGSFDAVIDKGTNSFL